MAFGPVYHGSDLDPEIAHVLGRHGHIRDSTLMRLPMVQAYHAEREAPPFDIVIDASARAFAPNGDRLFPLISLDWFRHARPLLNPSEMLEDLDEHFKWQTKHSNTTGYETDRIARHLTLATEFFALGQ